VQKGKFFNVSMFETHQDWQLSIARNQELYGRDDDIRTEFGRDYTRILHSTAYRRLKHKTQVFFATQNDHVCTRIEHVNHVASVGFTIAQYLGLNTELVRAIATGHDLGHAPFGHHGEVVLDELANTIGEKFWHEYQGLRVVDQIDTLLGPDGKENNLSLTYAVRDGIISHCGEVDENAVCPRKDYLSLDEIREANQRQPFTWEACVVKISDKIAYLGRDIEDALMLKIIHPVRTRELIKMVEDKMQIDVGSINNTTLMHKFIIDLCEESDPASGLVLSKKHLDLMNEIKSFNYENIYKHQRLKYYKDYARLIIVSIYEALQECNAGSETMSEIKEMKNYYPRLGQYFEEWLEKYSDIGRIQIDQKIKKRQNTPSYYPIGGYNNKIVYDIMSDKKAYRRASIDFIAGMTDNFAEKIFKELTSF